MGCAAVAALVLPARELDVLDRHHRQTSRIGDLASLGNQSVHGMLLRVGVPPRAALRLGGSRGGDLRRGAAAGTPAELDGDPVRAAVLVGCATVAASPVSWTHHQLWTVLAAMLLIATTGVARRFAGVVLLVTMVVSLGAVLARSRRGRGCSSLLENARAFGSSRSACSGSAGSPVAARPASAAVAGVAVGSASGHRGGRVRRGPAVAGRGRPDVQGVHGCRRGQPAILLLLPQPAGAPPRRRRAGHLRHRAEKTKVRVNGVVDAQLTRLEFISAPGGAPRPVPLLELTRVAGVLVPLGEHGAGAARRVRLGRSADRQLRRGLAAALRTTTR